MARARRIEYEGALYHVLSRGNERQDIFIENDDRKVFLATVGDMSERFGLTYSAVSQRVKITKEKLKKDRVLAKKLDQIKSIIKN